ncbi:MAG TPA: methyltransferase domain-containing protein [Ktedonobacterales bacterium]|nr:methyltransferase domain-containing protein [Ktedonobacterales bacterium]
MEHSATDNKQKSSGQAWDATLYDTSHAFVWKYGASVLELLKPQPGERVLDLGCGTGHLTAQMAAAGAEVVGIDKAASMIEQARATYPNLRFEVADGSSFSFPEPFDAVFSNAAIHWMREPAQVVACIAQALRPGGRFVAEFGGKGNVAPLIEAVYAASEAAGYPAQRDRSPWYYPSIGEYSSLLEQHSLLVTFATLFDRPTPLEHGRQGLRVWLNMFGSTFFQGIPADRQESILQDVEQRLEARFYRDGTWYVPYVRLRVVARKAEAD